MKICACESGVCADWWSGRSQAEMRTTYRMTRWSNTGGRGLRGLRTSLNASRSKTIGEDILQASYHRSVDV